MGISAFIALVLAGLSQTLSSGPVPATSSGMLAINCATPDQRIDVKGFVAIGGIDQWVTIRGDRCSNPAILFLHGGPGNPMSPYADKVYAGWEKHFTLVQWDQRGAGKTFGRNPPPTKLTIAGMTDDGVELSKRLATALGQEKIILLGGSWGSVLGIHMAKARPDLFHAYLGVGQLVEHQANLKGSVARLGALAKRAGDAKTLSALDALGTPPWSNPRNFGALRRLTRTYEAKAATPAPDGWWDAPVDYATRQSLTDYEAGEEYSYLAFVGETGNGMLSTVDLPRLGSRFLTPIFLVHGEADLVTVPAVAKAYFDTITAPKKAFTLVARAGHDPNLALIEAQYDVLRSKIRPLAERDSSRMRR